MTKQSRGARKRFDALRAPRHRLCASRHYLISNELSDLKAAPFDYVRAASVSEACELLRQDGEDIKLIAGGQSLVPMMAMRLTRPARLVDINEIGALKFIALEDGVARIGACTRQCVVARDDALAARVPLLRRALAWVGHAQTRNRGTLGGSLAHADPAAELPLAAQVLGASVRAALGSRHAHVARSRILHRPAHHRASTRTNVSKKSTGRCGPSAARAALSPK